MLVCNCWIYRQMSLTNDHHCTVKQTVQRVFFFGGCLCGWKKSSWWSVYVGVDSSGSRVPTVKHPCPFNDWCLRGRYSFFLLNTFNPKHNHSKQQPLSQTIPSLSYSASESLTPFINPWSSDNVLGISTNRFFYQRFQQYKSKLKITTYKITTSEPLGTKQYEQLHDQLQQDALGVQCLRYLWRCRWTGSAREWAL